MRADDAEMLVALMDFARSEAGERHVLVMNRPMHDLLLEAVGPMMGYRALPATVDVLIGVPVTVRDDLPKEREWVWKDVPFCSFDDGDVEWASYFGMYGRWRVKPVAFLYEQAPPPFVIREPFLAKPPLRIEVAP